MKRRRVVMGERVPRRELIHAIAELLARFADPGHPALNDFKFKRFRHKRTGVVVRSDWSDNPALVLFCFWIRGRTGTPEEVNQIVSVEFDIQDFHYNPTDYVTNMLAGVAKKVHESTKTESGHQNVVVDIRGNPLSP